MAIRRPRLASTTRRRLIDALLAVAFVPLSLPGLPDVRQHLAVALPLLVLASLPLALRRRWPWAVFAVVLGSTLALGVFVDPLAVPLQLMIALYTVALSEPARRARVAAAAAAIAWLAATISAGRIDLAPVLMLGAAFAIGTTLRARRAYVRAVEERAERLERERGEQARRAVTEERARIARELHDVIAHNVSVIVLHATAAARIFNEGPARGLEALEAIEATARQTVAELRSLLGVMRDQENADVELAPQPRLTDIGSLVDDVRALGLAVELDVDGEPDDLPAGVHLSAYRIIQEALTNIVKHGEATHSQVQLRCTPDVLMIEVVDNGRAKGSAPSGSGGHGLLGMRERVLLYGGELEAGPNEAGGFRIRATLPREAVR